jgi:hypothetical protein
MGNRRRAGRPRKEGPRYPSGRLVPPKPRDNGGPVLPVKWQQLFESGERAGSVLAILAEHGKIAPTEYTAGEGYAELSPHSGRRNIPNGTLGNSLKALATFNDAHAAIVRQRGQKIANIVEAIAILDQPPGNDATLRLLRAGLQALWDYFRELLGYAFTNAIDQEISRARASLKSEADWSDPDLFEMATWLRVAFCALEYCRVAGDYNRSARTARVTALALRDEFIAEASLVAATKSHDLRCDVLRQAIAEQDRNAAERERSATTLHHLGTSIIDRLRVAGVPMAFLSVAGPRQQLHHIILALLIAEYAVAYRRIRGAAPKLPSKPNKACNRWHGDFLDKLRQLLPLDAADLGLACWADNTIVNKVKSTLPVLRKVLNQNPPILLQQNSSDIVYR